MPLVPSIHVLDIETNPNLCNGCSQSDPIQYHLILVPVNDVLNPARTWGTRVSL